MLQCRTHLCTLDSLVDAACCHILSLPAIFPSNSSEVKPPDLTAHTYDLRQNIVIDLRCYDVRDEQLAIGAHLYQLLINLGHKD